MGAESQSCQNRLGLHAQGVGYCDAMRRERDEAAAAVRQARAESSAAPMAAAQGSRLDKVQVGGTAEKHFCQQHDIMSRTFCW